jgi:hypothetical protein
MTNQVASETNLEIAQIFQDLCAFTTTATLVKTVLSHLFGRRSEINDRFVLDSMSFQDFQNDL